jgi:cyclophilin family peptidyl-prolyl cis-trans isomerase
MEITITPAMLAFTALSFLSLLLSSAHAQRSVTFRNELAQDVELFWEGDEGRVVEWTLTKQGGEKSLQTFPHHVFSYHHNGEKYEVEIQENQSFVVLLGKRDALTVRCATTTDGHTNTNQRLDIVVHPSWSPRGACRFLELVRQHYYDGVALNRVVPNFLTQFGISADYDQRTKFRDKSILDDPPGEPNISFLPGMLSFAGSGPDSRTAEIFVVMPGTKQSQLEYFGKNPWETPFAIINGSVEESPVARWHSYGDMPPWGEGPDPRKIYEKSGYEYLKREFPKLDYIETCHIVEEEGDHDHEEEL